MRLWLSLENSMLLQRGHLFHWIPVALAAGIGGYFALLHEPKMLAYVSALGLTAALLFAARYLGGMFAPLLIGCACILIGFTLAGWRSNAIATPTLGFRYYGPIEGRIVRIDRSASDAVRLTLDQVVLTRMAPVRTPERVRVSLHGAQYWVVPEPGLRVMTTGHLSPPSGPAEPGGFDFRRMAWFQQLGAVGYTRNPVLISAPVAEGRAGLALHRLRNTISQMVRERIPNDAGGFAAAIMTGDRSGLSPEASDQMRNANLYHLISISGMHMGMLAAFVFGVVRYGVALIPPLALRLPGRKIAAMVALPAAGFYLALAGRAIPTERAFVMVAVMLVAILLDRRALTMRAVAIAALIVLVLRPESLLNPGFQMSFAAVVALVFVFGLLPNVERRRSWHGRILMSLGMLLVSSFVAGMATAPYAAAHFNRVAHYGLIANLLAVPVMGLLVMPGAVMFAILVPFGLGGPALWLVETGSRWILKVAEIVSGLDGAISALPQPPAIVLPLFTLGACFVVLWQGRGRIVGIVPVIVAFSLWAGSTRPALLVADSGGLIGVMSETGRILSKPRGDSFVAGIWLENDGDVISQEGAAARPGLLRQDRVIRLEIAGLQVVQVSGQRALASLDGCGGADILIVNVEISDERPCDVYDTIRLRDTGALALWPMPNAPALLQTTREVVGHRLWNDARVRR